MSPYRAVISARFRSLLQYRVAALAGFGTQLFWGFVKIMVLDAFYGSHVGSKPMALGAVVSYVWLGQAFLGMLPWNVDRDTLALVQTGDVAYELLRPVDTYVLWFSRALAWRTATPLLRAVPMFLFSMVLLPVIGAGSWALQLPPSIPAAIAFVLTMTVALVLSTALTTLLNTTLIWTLAGTGARTILPTVVSVFSGMIVPIPLLPDALQKVFMGLPFAYLVDVPYRLYTGHIAVEQLPGLLAVGIGWTLVILGAGRLLMARARRRLVVQGG